MLVGKLYNENQQRNMSAIIHVYKHDWRECPALHQLHAKILRQPEIRVVEDGHVGRNVATGKQTGVPHAFDLFRAIHSSTHTQEYSLIQWCSHTTTRGLTHIRLIHSNTHTQGDSRSMVSILVLTYNSTQTIALSHRNTRTHNSAHIALAHNRSLMQ